MRTASIVHTTSERGNAFIEFALCMLPFFALVFGIIDVSMVLFIKNDFQNAVREGVRYGITYNTAYGGTTYSSQTAAIKAVVEHYSVGFLRPANDSTYIQVNYYLPNNLSTAASQAGLPQTMPNGTVVNYVNQTGNVVEVRIQGFPWNWMVPMPGFAAGLGLTLSASASDVLQGLPVGVFTPPSP
jgi:Flp pilus assembly protein TadG